MKTDSTPSTSYATEFRDFGPMPKQIIAAIASAQLVDVSYRNDLCPSFIRKEDEAKAMAAGSAEAVPVLWVNYSDKSKREDEVAFDFLVSIQSIGFSRESDNAAEALRFLASAEADVLPVVVFNAEGHEQGRCTLAEFVADNAEAFPARLVQLMSRSIAERIKCLGHDTIDCGAGGVFTIRAESTESLWRVETTVADGVPTNTKAHVKRPFVDWYEGHTMEQVIQMAREDAFRYGLPEGTTFTARLATPGEIEAFREDT